MTTRITVAWTLASILVLGGVWPPHHYAKDFPPLEPPGVHARIFDSLERKIAACDPTTDVQRCVLDTIWETADVTADGKVSVAEINRLFRIVAGGVAYQTYVADRKSMTARRGFASVEPPENHELDFVIVAGSVGAFVTAPLIANFDYDSDGMLSRTEILGDSDFANLVSEVERQRKRFPERLVEAFERWRREMFGTDAQRSGRPATERRERHGKPTERDLLAEFCAVVPQSALCRDDKTGQETRKRREQEPATAERQKLAEFCAEVPQSVLCRDL